MSEVSKWYGNVVAVNDVSLEVYPGITGVLGPNGAGKTTLLYMIAGLERVFKRQQFAVLDQPVRDKSGHFTDGWGSCRSTSPSTHS